MGRALSLDSLFYGRHFLLLAATAAMLAAAHHWGQPGRWSASSLPFGLYGALHAAAVSVSLRIRQPLRRTLPFIGITACLSQLCAAAGPYANSLFVGALPGLSRPAPILALCSGLGAASYAFLIRRFWIPALSGRALIAITLGCVAATLAALALGIFLGTLGGLWLAAAWWFAFSTGLWCREVFSRGIH